MRPESVIATAILAFLLGYLIAFNGGCASAISSERSTLDTATRALAALDTVEAETYHQSAEHCLSESETQDAYAVCIRAHDRVVEAETVAYHLLILAEAAVDAQEAGHDRNALGALACAANALDELIDALKAIHVTVPKSVLDAIGAIRAVAYGACNG